MAKVDFKNRSTQTILLAFLAAVIGVGAKLTLTGGELLPGIDGAYYWVQVRSLLLPTAVSRAFFVIKGASSAVTMEFEGIIITDVNAHQAILENTVMVGVPSCNLYIFSIRI